jgi:hypothetical protein
MCRVAPSGDMLQFDLFSYIPLLSRVLGATVLQNELMCWFTTNVSLNILFNGYLRTLLYDFDIYGDIAIEWINLVVDWKFVDPEIPIAQVTNKVFFDMSIGSEKAPPKEMLSGKTDRMDLTTKKWWYIYICMYIYIYTMVKNGDLATKNDDSTLTK